MKTFSIFNFLFALVLIPLPFISGNKTQASPTNFQSADFESSDVACDLLFPLAGDWVLKYSDGGPEKEHTDYPQDSDITSSNNGPRFSTWASHLSLLGNDSAYWNSGGVDEMPVRMASGTYSLSSRGSGHALIEFSFTINNHSKFEYTLKGNDTLKLNDLSAIPVIYTYARK